jgi:hypothetical protein
MLEAFSNESNGICASALVPVEEGVLFDLCKYFYLRLVYRHWGLTIYQEGKSSFLTKVYEA